MFPTDLIPLELWDWVSLVVYAAIFHPQYSGSGKEGFVWKTEIFENWLNSFVEISFLTNVCANVHSFESSTQH